MKGLLGGGSRFIMLGQCFRALWLGEWIGCGRLCERTSGRISSGFGILFFSAVRKVGLLRNLVLKLKDSLDYELESLLLVLGHDVVVKSHIFLDGLEIRELKE